MEQTLKEAEKGNAEAQRSLGMRYYQGTGVAQNYEEAVKWLRKSYIRNDEDTYELLKDIKEWDYSSYHISSPRKEN